MIYEVTIGDRVRSVRIDRTAEQDGHPRYSVAIDDGEAIDVGARWPDDQALSLLIGGRCREVGVGATEQGF